MIANDAELQGTRARIVYFEDLLAQMRVAARADLFPNMASGYPLVVNGVLYINNGLTLYAIAPAK